MLLLLVIVSALVATDQIDIPAIVQQLTRAIPR